MKFSFRVPATSANLGPGFDCLGIAWNIYANFHFHTRGPRFERLEELALYKKRPDFNRRRRKNLVLDAYWAYGKLLDLALPDMGVYIDSDIPSTRGLGSSAACIVGGVEAARFIATKLYPDRALSFSDASLLRVASLVEGHPDNVAPALYGGLQISRMEEGKAFALPLKVHPSLHFFVLVPNFSTSTAKSRASLPERVKREDAVFNLSSLAFLLEGLRTGREKALKAGFRDRLHESYRTAAIKNYGQILELGKEHGALAMVLSGAGSSILALAKKKADQSFLKEMAKALPPEWSLRPVAVDFQGAKLLREE